MEIIKQNIVKRFNGSKIEFARKIITIADDLKLQLQLPETPTLYADLFNELVEKLTNKPLSLPYGGPEYSIEHATSLLVLGLDECQVNQL